MSWDLVLFNSTEKINLIEDIDESSLIEIDFDTLLSDFFPNKKEDSNHIKILGNDFSLEYFKRAELVSNKMITIYGKNGIYELAKFAKKHNFQIYDTGIEKMIDLENPENNGYKNFQKYRNQVLKEKE
ncbi:MAG: hypothetical protein WCY89_10210 [Flavobacteriaceae bacterium]